MTARPCSPQKATNATGSWSCTAATLHSTTWRRPLPQKMGMEIRKERYERAVKWLEGVQAGKIVPDLPVVLDEDGEPVSGTFIYGCQKKQRYNW